MKILICGSRDWIDYHPILEYVKKQKDKYGKDLIIIDGGADGVDKFAHLACIELEVINREYPIIAIHRRLFRKLAGRVRNEEMYNKEKPNRIVAFKHEISPGTEHMIQIGKDNNVEVEVYYE